MITIADIQALVDDGWIFKIRYAKDRSGPDAEPADADHSNVYVILMQRSQVTSQDVHTTVTRKQQFVERSPNLQAGLKAIITRANG